jgi:hypothetical protein
VPTDDDSPSWAKHVLGEARRVGLRPDDHADLLELAGQLERHIAAQVAARGRPDPDGLEPWQRRAVAGLLVGFVCRVVASLLTRPPRSALLITLVGDDGGLGEIAVDERVAVEVTLKGGRTMTLRPTAVVEAGGLMRGVEQVETVAPSLGYILWVGRWPSCTLLAWDLRGLLLSVSDEQLDNLLARLRGVAAGHPQQSPGWYAREEREATLRRMDRDEQRMVMRQAFEDELVDPKSRRLPVRGIIRAGTTAIWDAGSTGSPYGLLQKLSALLRRERKWQERETEEQVASEPAAEQPEFETLIREYTEGLVAKQHEAVQHYLRASLIYNLDLKTYCAKMGIPYEATRRAATRGLRRLREKN